MSLLSPIVKFSTHRYMVKKSARYELFKSEHRGSAAIESKLGAMLERMQTPDNLDKLLNVVSAERWEKSQPGKMNFSDFEEKFNKAKEELFRNCPR